MTRWLTTAIFIILFLPVHGGDTIAVIRGKVLDNISGEPLSGASIVFGEGQGNITSSTGEFQNRIPAGKHALVCQYVGYKSFTSTFYLHPGDTLDLEIRMDREINEIDQVVVSANRTEQRLAESTVSLSIIRPDVAAKAQITDAEDLINKTPGIEVLDGQASVRGGSGFSYGAGSRVLALIDGLPVVAADAGNIKWQFLPLENISQVEIIKGAASVLYGSSALNGIINFRTADATVKPQTKFYAETGVYGRPANDAWVWWDSPRLNSSASFSHIQKTGNTDIGISGTVLSDEGYRRLNDEMLGRMSLSLKHHVKKMEGLVFGVNINGGYTLKRDFLLWENALTGALKQSGTTVLQLHGSFLAVDPYITFKKSDRFRHDIRMRVQSSINRFPEKSQNNSDALNYFAEYQGLYKLNGIFSLNTGLSENYSRVISDFYGDHSGLNLATLAQLNVSPGDRLKMIAGIRFEYNSLDTQKDRLVPVFRTGLNYKVFEYTYLRASFGQGYRYPSIAEKYASTTLGAIRIYPNPEVKSETGWNSEIGIKQGIQMGDFKGQADLALFFTQNSRMIEYIFGYYPDPVTSEFNYGFKASNVEQSRVYGYEFEYLLKHSAGNVSTVVSGGYIYMYPVEYNAVTGKNSDVFLKYRRKHSAKLSIENKYRKFDLGIDLYAKSRLLNIDDVFLNELTRETILPGFYDYWNANNRAYFLADMNIGIDLSEKYELSMSIKNVTNTEYMGRPGDIRPPRSIGLRFSGRF
jgi:outer membrane receptor protein involved in Fe transport